MNTGGIDGLWRGELGNLVTIQPFYYKKGIQTLNELLTSFVCTQILQAWRGKCGWRVKRKYSGHGSHYKRLLAHGGLAVAVISQSDIECMDHMRLSSLKWRFLSNKLSENCGLMLDLVLWKASSYCNTLRVTYLTNNRKKSTEARVLRDQILLSGRPLRF